MIGILALQGNFAMHQEKLQQLGCGAMLVRNPHELAALSGLVIPGGESTTLLRLMDDSFRSALQQSIHSGLPLFGTCAGAILLARTVVDSEQHSFAAIDIDVERNSYGRQVDSFIDNEMQWTRQGRELLASMALSAGDAGVEGVFIRAPRIVSTGPNVETLVVRDDEPVLVRQNNVLAATFHPEATSETCSIHELFLKMAGLPA